jgi:hypothetical protein
MRGRKTGDDDLAEAMEAMVTARQQANEDMKVARSLEAEAEARRVALEERMVAVEERKLALEEKKVAMEEHQHLVEEERRLFCIDTSDMDERHVNSFLADTSSRAKFPRSFKFHRVLFMIFTFLFFPPKCRFRFSFFLSISFFLGNRQQVSIRFSTLPLLSSFT